MGSKLKYKRILSLILSVLLIVSCLPITTFANNSMANGGNSDYKIPHGKGPGNDDWDGIPNMWGYKITLRFAPLLRVEGSGADQNPVYDWDNSWQIGYPTYFRAVPINNGSNDIPAFYGGGGSVYDLAKELKPKDWRLLKTWSNDRPFIYYIFDGSNHTQDRINYDLDNFYKTFASIDNFGFKDLQQGEQPNKGQIATQDYLNRMFNMCLDKTKDSGLSNVVADGVGISNITSYEQAKSAGTKYMTPSNAKLTFIEGIAKSGGNRADCVDYLKSYFLNPVIMNQILWCIDVQTQKKETINGVERIIGETVGVDNVVLGTYVSPKMLREQWQGTRSWEDNIIGEYKFYIEPVAFRMYDGTFGVMSYQEVASHYRLKKQGLVSDANATVMGAGAVPQMANYMRLQTPDSSMKNTMVQGDYNDVDESIIMNPKTNLGMWVLSSPSFYATNNQERPEIIKMYVTIDSIDENGNITYKTASKTRMGQAAFSVDEKGNRTTVPAVDMTTYEAYEGVSLINDVITTDKELKITDNTEWTNTKLPTGLLDKETSLPTVIEDSAEDIAGYCFGIQTGCTEDIYEKIDTTITQGDISTYYSTWLARAEGYEQAQATSVASAAQETRFDMVPTGRDENGNVIWSNSNIYETTITTATPYTNLVDIRMGKIEDGNVYKVLPEEKEKLGIKTPANTIIIRYILVPLAKQYNIVEIYNETTGQVEQLIPSVSELVKDYDWNGLVQIPEGVDMYEQQPQLVEWVTNAELPSYNLVELNGNLPPVSPEGKSGNSMKIEDYPNNPIDHNLYVKWRITIQDPPPADLTADVPEWRLSKYFKAYSDIDTDLAGMSLSLKTGGCGHGYYLGNPGYWNYSVINPSGSSSKKVESWIHAETIKSNDRPYVSTGSPSATVRISADINAIKSTDTSGLRVANWLDKGSQTGLLNYDVLSSATGTAFSENTYYKSRELSLGVKNNVTYYSKYLYKTGSDPHEHDYTTANAGVSYNYGLLPTKIGFDRYNQKDTTPLSVEPKLSTENAYTSYSYQLNSPIKVYPEYGMLFDNDSNVESIKWMVGDKAREIKPVVYQTLRYKVYVQPNSTGSSMATDSRALTATNKLAMSDGSAKGKQVLYKGSPVNTGFQLFRDESKSNAAILTAKTFVIDYNDNKGVQSAWGMDSYKPETEHSKLISGINGTNAKTYEKLLVSGNGVSYTGGTKQQQSNKFEIVKYNGKDYVTFTHELIIRGGHLIGVKLDGDSSVTSIENLKTKSGYKDLYNAIVESKLYNEGNDKSQTVFNTFEHKAENSDVLSEDAYATLLLNARNDGNGGIANPSYANINNGDKWYSEDTTVLVLREYVSNFSVPSISYSDKLSLSVNGLETPIDKSLFFSKLGKGYVYLKYDLPLVMGDGKSTNVYFEYDSMTNPLMSEKIEISNRSLGYQGVNYIVPNVSVTDTTRQ